MKYRSYIQPLYKSINKDTKFWDVVDEVTAMRENTKYKIISSAQVDGDPWYTIKCNKEISSWIKTQSSSWHEHCGVGLNVHLSTFDINEELHMMMVLKFGQ